MANCNKLFLDFNNALNIIPTKQDRLKISMRNIKNTIRSYFKQNYPAYSPRFATQGSYKLGTMIRTQEDTCDLDLGIYFFRKPHIESHSLQSYVWNAVENSTGTAPKHKNKCIRVIYAGDYHIDLPIYYKLQDDNNDEHPLLATKTEGYILSDPLEFQQWFKSSINNSAQLIRIIRYLKAWCNYKYNRMPSGLIMTVLVEKYFSKDERDDIALLNTLKAIEKSPEIKYWECSIPTTPQDDLLKSYNETQKKNFRDNIEYFIEDGSTALGEPNQLRASKLWKKHLGIWFPEGSDEDVALKEKLIREKMTVVQSGIASTNSAGVIIKTSDDTVKNPPHKFYGE